MRYSTPCIVTACRRPYNGWFATRFNRSMLKVVENTSKQRAAGRSRDSNARQPAPDATRLTPVISSTLGLGLLGGLLLWAAFPPLNLPWLAWITPLPWLW